MNENLNDIKLPNLENVGKTNNISDKFTEKPGEETEEEDLSLHLDRLTSAEGLVLPKAVGGNIDFSNLTNTEDIVLPQSIGKTSDKDIDGEKGLSK